MKKRGHLQGPHVSPGDGWCEAWPLGKKSLWDQSINSVFSLVQTQVQDIVPLADVQRPLQSLSEEGHSQQELLYFYQLEHFQT